MTGKIERKLDKDEVIILAGFALFGDEVRKFFFDAALRAIDREKTKGRSAEVIDLAERRFKSCTK